MYGIETYCAGKVRIGKDTDDLRLKQPKFYRFFSKEQLIAT
jgi:hypothetical protein